MKLSVHNNNGWTGGQYSLFRILLGIYLTIHFTHLLAWSIEVFSSHGMISNSTYSPLMAYFPNLLKISDAPIMVICLLLFAIITSIFFTLGYKDKLAALLIWYVLACLFTRNPLIANPSMPYTGWMLLAHLFIPAKPCGSIKNNNNLSEHKAWKMPNEIFIAAWVVLAVSYSYSGYTKLFSPSWVSGNNIAYVLENPLARDYFLRSFFLSLPPIYLQLLTWTVLYVELFFAPLSLFKRARPILWSIMFIIQLGFAFLLNFIELTASMLLFHLLTFNPEWMTPREFPKGSVLFYDGNCALCHGWVKFMLSESKDNEALLFSPLQGELFHKIENLRKKFNSFDSIVLLENGHVYIKSSAVARLFCSLGGLWRLIGIVLLAIPKPIRDWGYMLIGNNRYKIFGNTSALCPLVPKNLQSKFKISLGTFNSRIT